MARLWVPTRGGITILKPDDFHVHLRWGKMLELVIGFTANVFARAVVMPNLKEMAVTTAEAVAVYLKAIKAALPPDSTFTPRMTIKIMPETTPDVIITARRADIRIAKLYPDGVTTNSEGGVSGILGIRALYPVFKVMEELGMVLSLHGEMPGEKYKANRELGFLPVLQEIALTFPRLRIVFEHVSTAEGVALVRSLPNVAATITVHHLVLTKADLRNPHNYCLPPAKKERDRLAVLKAALSGDPHFFLGTDSAPHPVEVKEGGALVGGVFSAPIALELLVTIFEREGCLHQLQWFACRNGAEFYGLPFINDTLELVREQWVVPSLYRKGGVAVKPFMADQLLPYRLHNDHFKAAT